MTPPVLRRSTRPRRSVVRDDKFISDMNDVDKILDRLDHRKPRAVVPGSGSDDSDSDVYKPSQSLPKPPSKPPSEPSSETRPRQPRPAPRLKPHRPLGPLADRHQCEYHGIEKEPWSQTCCLIVLLQALRGLCKVGKVVGPGESEYVIKSKQRCHRDFLDYWENGEDMNRLLASMEKETGYRRKEMNDPAALLGSLGLGVPWLLSPTAPRLHDCSVGLPPISATAFCSSCSLKSQQILIAGTSLIDGVEFVQIDRRSKS